MQNHGITQAGNDSSCEISQQIVYFSASVEKVILQYFYQSSVHNRINAGYQI